jgi:hypothetical protein
MACGKLGYCLDEAAVQISAEKYPGKRSCARAALGAFAGKWQSYRGKAETIWRQSVNGQNPSAAELAFIYLQLATSDVGYAIRTNLILQRKRLTVSRVWCFPFKPAAGMAIELGFYLRQIVNFD